MYAKTVEFLRSNWKLYLAYYLLFSFLHTLAFLVPDEVDLLSFPVSLLAIYLFINFLLVSSMLIKNGRKYESLGVYLRAI